MKGSTGLPGTCEFFRGFRLAGLLAWEVRFRGTLGDIVYRPEDAGRSRIIRVRLGPRVLGFRV